MVENDVPKRILLVDDSEQILLLTREAFRKAEVAVEIDHAADGLEALRFLRKEDEYENSRTPDLILLDLNMPVMSGREFFEVLVQDPTLAHLPVVVFTSSNDLAEAQEMYRLRCSGYLRKPIEFAELTRLMRLVADYWFSAMAPHQV